MHHSVPGRSQLRVLESLLSNIFVNDLFFMVEETKVWNCAADKTIYVCGRELEHIVSGLETDAGKLSGSGFLITV